MPKKEMMVFDIGKQTVIPINIKNEEGGIEEYELREASGDDACRWKNAIIERTMLGPDGKPTGMKNIADTEPILVSLCLYDVSLKKKVPVSKVRSWPARVQKALFEKAKEISDLDEDDEAVQATVKNGQTGTTAGS